MHVVVLGLGQVGQNVVRALELAHHDVVAVDNDPAQVEWAEEHFDVGVVCGYAASQRVLREAGADRADLAVAVTDQDETNLVAALMARHLGAKRVIARVQGLDWADLGNHEGVATGLLGVDVVFNPRVLVARELAKIAKSRGALEVIDLADDRIEIVKLKMVESSRLAEKALARLDLPRDVRIGAIVRDGNLFVPGGADVLLPADEVYLVGLPAAINQAQSRFTDRVAASRVCIVGGGVAGETLARGLAGTGVEVMLIERDAEVAEALAAKVPEVTIIRGDGTELALLEEYRVGDFDLFVAVTQEDEVNLLAGLLARRVGVGRIATLVHRPEYQDIYRQLGIDIVLSPRTVAAEHILRHCRGDELRSLTVLEGGAAEVVELTVPPGARIAHTTLAKAGLPRGALVCAIIKPSGVVVPGGEDVIEPGDSVIVLCTTAASRAVVRLFKPSAF